MNNGINTITIIVVALIVIGGAYYWYQGGVLPWKAEPTEYGGGVSATVPSDTLPTGADASNNALDQDAAAIEAQLDAFASDNAGIDAGLNDVAGEQSSL